MNKTNENQQFNWKPDALTVLSPAKLNLSLLIAGKRPDGFHEIETVMAKIDFFDEITISKSAKPGIHFTCVGPQWAPKGPENLVYQAAEQVFKHSAISSGVNITLNKRIPAGTGLGSASSNAAATLLGLSRFFHLPLEIETVTEIATQLGSDVAFFLYGPQSICRGKGEKIKTLATFFEFTALVILPNLTISTKRIYESYRHNPDIYQHLHHKINGYLDKNRVDFMAKSCTNMLSSTCFSLHRGLAELKETIESLGIGPLCLSGSGSALYAIVDKKMYSKIGKVRSHLRREFKCDSQLVHSIKW